MNEKTIPQYFAVDRQKISLQKPNSEKNYKKIRPNDFFQAELLTQCSKTMNKASTVNVEEEVHVADISLIELDETSCEKIIQRKLAACGDGSNGNSGGSSVDCNNPGCVNKVYLAIIIFFFGPVEHTSLHEYRHYHFLYDLPYKSNSYNLKFWKWNKKWTEPKNYIALVCKLVLGRICALHSCPRF